MRAAANFLKRRCPQLMGPGSLKDDATLLSKSHQLPTETLGIMLHSLQIFAGYDHRNYTGQHFYCVENCWIIIF